MIVAACSSADPSAGGGASIEGAYALATLDCQSNGPCPQQTVDGAAVAVGAVWLTRDEELCNPQSGNGNCIAPFTSTPHLERVAFGADGGVDDAGGAGPFVTSTQAFSSGVGVTDDGATIYFAYDDPNKNVVFLQALTAAGADAGVASFGDAGQILGVAAEAQAAVVAVGNSGGGQGSDTSGFSFNGSPPSSSEGALYRINFADGGVTPLSSTFATTYVAHLFVAAGSQLYWASPSAILSAPRDLSTPPAQVGSIASGTPVGLSVSGGDVSWSTLDGTSDCNNGPCTFTASACKIFRNGALAWDSSALTTVGPGCIGLATDASYAYFALVQVQPMQCNDCSGLTHVTFTTAIARIAFAGSTNQTPSLVPVDTTRLYGPRRFFLDDTYLYGIDPAYVVRVKKSAFGP